MEHRKKTLSFHNSNNQDFLKQGRWKIEGLLVARTYPPNFCHYKKEEILLSCPPKFQDLPPSLNFVLILSLSLCIFCLFWRIFLETDYYSNIFFCLLLIFFLSLILLLQKCHAMLLLYIHTYYLSIFDKIINLWHEIYIRLLLEMIQFKVHYFVHGM